LSFLAKQLLLVQLKALFGISMVQYLEPVRAGLGLSAVLNSAEKTVLKALNLRGGRISFFASSGENHEYEKDSRL
jgi:hypothetical protein